MKISKSDDYLHTSSVVVIPIYKNFSELTYDEKISLNRTFDVFVDEDVFILISDSVNRDDYNSTYSLNLKYRIVSDIHFKNINTYSKLLMSSYFYSLFKDYTWMLICQLDAYAFRNDLNLFTHRQDFYFLGAPVINTNLKGWENISWVGNGGFSLRRIDICYNVSYKLERLKKKLDFIHFISIENNFLSSLTRFILGKMFKLKFNKYLTRYLLETPVNEDIFWSLWIPSIFSNLKPADIHTATKFSFEVSPEQIFNSVGCLPMGCHAWKKYNPIFWENILQRNEF